ncbi:hypothetical protein FACS1894205_6940 [Alphaproteobacteria bacterium]|nr:hypothetical protein FACS1894205_6940 [Alphaproteobacteria bacterium]
MCTFILLRRPDAPWPVLIAANRDEMADRAALAPGRHWPDRPNVTAGYDELAHGSWMGINDEGVVAAILNRAGTLGPEKGKRSRGELVLEALDCADAACAADALSHLSATAYRPFNMIVADNRDAFWLKNDGSAVRRLRLGYGLSMVAANDVNDDKDQRIRNFRDSFIQLAPPEEKRLDWTGWKKVLASPSPAGNALDGMCFRLKSGFQTRSASLAALPSRERPNEKPIWLFSETPPDQPCWTPVSL